MQSRWFGGYQYIIDFYYISRDPFLSMSEKKLKILEVEEFQRNRVGYKVKTTIISTLVKKYIAKYKTPFKVVCSRFSSRTVNLIYDKSHWNFMWKS